MALVCVRPGPQEGRKLGAGLKDGPDLPAFVEEVGPKPGVAILHGQVEVIQQPFAGNEALDGERLNASHRAKQLELPDAHKEATEGDNLLLKAR